MGAGKSWGEVAAELIQKLKQLAPNYTRAHELPTRRAADTARDAGNAFERSDAAAARSLAETGRTPNPTPPAGSDIGKPNNASGSNPERRVRLDLATPDYTAKLAEAPIYRKKSLVRARIAEEGELVETVLADGTRETTNRTRAGQVVITNPGGEEYIYKAAETDIDAARTHFRQRHEETEEAGVYRAKGKIRAIPNDTGHPIEIMAPWGEPQYADVGGKIGTPFDPEKPDEISLDRYLIGGQEFIDTYELDT